MDQALQDFDDYIMDRDRFTFSDGSQLVIQHETFVALKAVGGGVGRDAALAPPLAFLPASIDAGTALGASGLLGVRHAIPQVKPHKGSMSQGSQP